MKDLVLNTLWKYAENRSHLKPSRLIDRLSKTTGLSIVDVKAALGQLSREGRLKGVTPKGDITGNVQVLVTPPSRPLSALQEVWKNELSKRGYTDSDCDRLMWLADYFEGMTAAQMQQLLDGIEQIKQNMSTLINADPYTVSAQYLLGSSKALRVLADTFQISFAEFNGRAAYVVVAGPQDPESVLFIENLASFEQFCESDSSNRMMAVATFGYGLQWSGLAKSMRSGRLTYLIRKGTPPRLHTIIDRKPLFFWGDLDREGLMIFMQLNQVMPNLKISALYLPMIEAITSGRCHPYGKLSDKDGQRKIVTNDDGLLGSLVKFCEKQAVDQEIVADAMIDKFCFRPLFLDDFQHGI